MSGPKVIRIVTREEILAICRGMMAQVNEVLSVCERDAARSHVLNAETSARWRSEVARLEDSLKRDEFRAFQKQAPQLIETIRHEMAARIESQQSAAAATRRRTTSLMHTARQLQTQLRDSTVNIPQDLSRQLQDAAAGRLEVDQLEQVVAQTLRNLPTSSEAELTPQQRETLRKLSGEDSMSTFAEWVATAIREPPQMKQLDRCVGQLAACGATVAAATLTDRMDLLQQEANSERRNLLMESLCLEAAALVRKEQQHAAMCQAASDLRVAIQSAGDGELCREGLERLASALHDRKPAAVQAEMKALQEQHHEAARQRAVQASRLALLSGLKELGYSVHEGMATLWNQQQKLIVRHPQKKGTAVELGVVGQNNQFQARVVALQNESRETKSDHQVETEWCDSLEQIQSKIAQTGAELRIERAIAAGQNPLKVVQWETESADTHDLERSRNNERSL
jgi:hypothetical protein